MGSPSLRICMVVFRSAFSVVRWTALAHMPKGMTLKSDGFASNIYDPENAFTLGQFCAERGIEYADTGISVRLETFTAYGLAFRDRMVPELEDKLVASVDRLPERYCLQLEDGETVQARAVVLAIGITHFAYVPENLAHLPAEFLSHSARHHEVEPFRGRDVVVIGGGSSALDLQDCYTRLVLMCSSSVAGGN